jgi:hypothetical protein
VDVKARIIALALLAVMVATSLVVEKEIAYRVPSGASPFNPGPEGTSDLVNVLRDLGYDVKVVTSWTDDLVNLSPHLIIIVSPEAPYAEKEVEIIKTLTSRGASILIADEGTLSNKVLESLDIPVRITGLPVSFNGSPTSTVKTVLSGRELKVIYAYASSLQSLPTHDGSLTTIASSGGDIIAVIYEVRGLRAAIISDGTVMTNALINPANPLNHNYVFVVNLVRMLCPEGVLLIDGSKYRLRPQPPVGLDSPIVSYLDPLARILGLAVLFVTLMYSSVSSPTLRDRMRMRPTGPKRYSGYDAAIKLCSTELAETLGCKDLRKVGDVVKVLEKAALISRNDRDAALRMLKALLGVEEY